MLCYGPGADSTCLQIYSDADYVGDVDSACSTSGHAVFIGKCLVNWSSKRQPVVAKSTTEAEYIAANEAGSDGVWFWNFTSELGYPPAGATPLWLDNQQGCPQVMIHKICIKFPCSIRHFRVQLKINKNRLAY
jgi:hypothetical protein